MPKVTVLMAVYNGERYLPETIESVLLQTFQDFEFLIINDSSTDSTREIILSYNDPRIRLVDNESNLGLTQSLNKGLELAQGELIARQDGDDISDSERLAKQVSFLETHPEVALLGTCCRTIDARSNVLTEDWLYPNDYIQILWALLFQNSFAHTSVMFRKNLVLEHIGFYNEDFVYAQDYEFWSRIARKFQVANLNECLVRYRINPLSMTATYGGITYDEKFQIQFSNIQNLLGCQEHNSWRNQTMELEAMTLLWSGNITNVKYFNFQYLNNIIKEIFKIYSLFCSYYKLSYLETKKCRKWMCQQLSINLLKIADYYCQQQDKRTADLFFVCSISMNKNILFNKQTIRLGCKLYLAPQLVRIIKFIKNRIIVQQS